MLVQLTRDVRIFLLAESRGRSGSAEASRSDYFLFLRRRARYTPVP
jgi:hypothetical protein